ncbi:hypothetical protein PWEIH_01465 [Listeria weihenstephanensis FSL R9-0317]|uniref:immunoglobulin-like domain-containing protein n=1 Tax=Listeria weihenstephanensis TaxID=1006155 RepID=UPI0003E8649B|nr:immunoglobulin-like domain-containing protein [Listeria weihenstephanensis]EUJ41293.1 hypothetical protein PWEIH_01465 [Listeria weihenstephanensis FSL R9-0317]
MKKKQTLLFLIVLVGIIMVGFGRPIYADELKTKQINSLEKTPWFQNAGLTKGITQDKQDLGIILPANMELEVRQTNPIFTDSLVLELLNDDRQTEKEKPVTSAWQTISSNYVTVPFIRTPRGEVRPVLEYRVKGDSKPLPIYTDGSKESEFFGKWDSTNAEFGLITSKYFQMLVPKLDKVYVRNMPDFSSIDQLCAYYSDIFETYNKLAGISFSPVNPTDKNIPNRYFIKANAHGEGYAYYGVLETGQNESSISAYLTKGWVVLHEIAHGYQGAFMERSSFDVNEVWNNIYAESYERKYYGADYLTKGTQTKNGEKEVREASFNKVWQLEHQALNKWSGSDKERLFSLFMRKGGDEGLTNFNQQYRKLANMPNFVRENYDLLDLMSKYFGETSGFDFTPVLESVRGTTEEKLQQDIEYKDYKAVAPLKELVSASELENAQKKLNLESYLSLVDTDQMAELKLTGNATIKLSIDDFSQISGGNLVIKNGAKIVKTVKITSETINLGSLPKGIYTVYVPTGNSQKYSIDQRYLKVQNDENTLTMKYTPKKMSHLINPVNISMLGLAEWKIGYLDVDIEKEQMVVNINKAYPNFLFGNSQYMKVQVIDEKGKETYNKEIKGDNEALFSDKVVIKEGYKISIFYAEPNFLRFNNAGFMDKNIIFTVTASGLQDGSLGANGLDWVKVKIDDAAKQIRNNPTMFASDYSTLKDDVLLAIKGLPESARSELMETYKDVLPKDLSQPSPASIEGPSVLNVEQTNTGTLTTQVLPVAADQGVNFESSNKGVMTIDASGNWHAVGKGEAVITITSKVDNHITKKITVKVTEKMDYSLAVNAYKLDSGTLTGKFGKHISKVRLWINGKVVTQATTNAAGEYVFDNASSFIHSATDVAEVVGVDSAYVERARIKVPVTGQSESNTNLTQNPYNIGDMALTGQFGKAIFKVRLFVNGIVVTQATTSEDGTYTFANASNFIKSSTDKIEIVGVDTQYKEVKRIVATVTGKAPDTSLQAKEFTFGDKTITGTFGTAISKVRLAVNGTIVQQATTVDGGFTFTSTNYLIKNPTDKVEIIGVDAQYKEIKRIVLN